MKPTNTTTQQHPQHPNPPAWTPGPLIVEGNSQDGEFYHILTRYTVQRPGSPVDENLHLATVYSRPDAELYAAAPEMAEALAKCANMLDVAFDCEDDAFGVHHNDAGDALLLARALLARINGEGGAS